MSARGLVVLVCLGAAAASGAEVKASPWQGFTSLNFSLGSMRPDIDKSSGLQPSSTPYASTFPSGSALLFQVEVDRFIYSQFGSAGVGVRVGYAEKYAPATYAATGATAPVKTGLQFLPLEVLALYRLDYAALHWHVPLVPYAKLGLIYEPWWATVGGSVQTVQGQRSAGGRWGWGWTVGGNLMLDAIEPQMGRDATVDLGIEHINFFVEYNDDIVTGFGSKGIDLSNRRVMYGLSFDF